MDTNINHYTIDEIYSHIFKTNKSTSVDSLYGYLINMLKMIYSEEVMELEEKKKINTFFKDCFYKICKNKNFETTETMDTNINSYIYKKQVYKPLEVPKIVPENMIVNTNVSDYAKGEVNPIKRETIKNTLIINTKLNNNNGYSSTDFIVDLTEPLNNIVSLKVAGLAMTNGFSNLSKNYRNLHFSIETYTRDKTTNEVANTYKREIILKQGYYDIRTLIAKLTELFDADSKLSMISMVYLDLKGKVFFALKTIIPIPPPANTNYEFNLYFDGNSVNKYVNIGYYFGFRKTRYMFKDDYIKYITVTNEIGFNPESLLDLSGTKFFLLEVTDFNNNAPQVVIYNTSDEGFRINDILAKIPNLSIMSTVQFEDSSDRIFKTRKYFGPIRLKKLRIRVLDEYGLVVEMDNGDMVLTFEVETLDIPYKNLTY